MTSLILTILFIGVLVLLTYLVTLIDPDRPEKLKSMKVTKGRYLLYVSFFHNLRVRVIPKIHIKRSLRGYFRFRASISIFFGVYCLMITFQIKNKNWWRNAIRKNNKYEKDI